MNYRILFLAPLAALVLSAGAAELRIPNGWFATKVAIPADRKNLDGVTNGYEVGLDPSAGGPPTLTIRSKFPQAQWPFSTASVYQMPLLGYAGKRVRFSGELRAAGVHGWSGLYLLDGSDELSGAVRSAGYGEKPLPMGTVVPADGGWHAASVVLDVPADATLLSMGLGLVGEGQVWARNLRFEIVGPEVAPTRTPIGVDLELARRFQENTRAETAKAPPAPLKNAALD